MSITDTPPEQLSERELFDEYMEIIDDPHRSSDGYDAARFQRRRSALLAEIAERLETLEAVKAIVSDAEPSNRGIALSEVEE